MSSPRAPRLGLQTVGRSYPPPSSRSFDTSPSEVPRPGHVEGSSAWPRRRFVGLATSKVPRLKCAGGLSPLPRPSNILRHGKTRRFPPSSPTHLRRCLSPCICSIITRGMSTSVFLRTLCMHLHGGSLGEGYPPTLHTSEVPQVKDILRRYQGEGCGHSPT